MCRKIEMCGKAEKITRVAALDAAKGAAVAGMYIQHFALNQWNGNLASGNTMILFMLCSGMSYSLMKKSGLRILRAARCLPWHGRRFSCWEYGKQ